MIYFLLAGGLGGILFVILDGLIHANPLAVRLMAAYKPIARPSVNIIAGIAIDLAYGFILAALFLVLKPAIPATNGLVKGLLFGAGVWFLRTVMSALSQWVTFAVPFPTIACLVVSGLCEMLALGIVFGLILAR
jgi:hypothetical protein